MLSIVATQHAVETLSIVATTCVRRIFVSIIYSVYMFLVCIYNRNISLGRPLGCRPCGEPWDESWGRPWDVTLGQDLAAAPQFVVEALGLRHDAPCDGP